ncbi:hypothetical protein Agub_g6520, partial [Astrephomene gubernaculifera]
NKHLHGFYGPLGTQSRQEAEGGVGRSCAECGTTSTYAWRGHKQRPGLMVCNACHLRYKRAGTYARNRDGSPRPNVQQDAAAAKPAGGITPGTSAAGAALPKGDLAADAPVRPP